MSEQLSKIKEQSYENEIRDIDNRIGCPVGTLHAADQTTTTPDSQNQWQNEHQLGKPERADKIIGREIKDAQDQKSAM